MTDYKIAPLTWLNNKYSQINHNHELYEEKYVNRTTDTPSYTDSHEIWDEATQQYYQFTVYEYLQLYGYEMEFSIGNFNELTGNTSLIQITIQYDYYIFIKEMSNGNGVWFYTHDSDGGLWDTLALVNDCNFSEVAYKQVTTEEPETGISKNAEIKVNVNSNRIIFNVYENNILTNTIRIFLDNSEYKNDINTQIGSVNFEGFTIIDKISYLEPKIISINDKVDDGGVVYYYNLGRYGKVNYNVTFNEDGQDFSIDELNIHITYYNNVIYDGDYTDDKPIKQDNEIDIEVLLNDNGVIIILSENIIKLRGRERDVYHNGAYQTLNVIGTIDEVGNRATEEEVNQLWNNVSNKEYTSNKITQWSNSPSNTKYTSEKLVKDSLDGKQEKLVSGTNLRTLDGIDLLGEGDIVIDVSCEEDSTTIFEDDCSSASGLSNYGSSECIRGSNATMTMEYDSTENAYKVYGSGNYHCYMPINALNGKTQYKLSADIKGQAIKYNMIGFFIDNCMDTTSYGLSVGLDIGKTNNINQRLWSRLFRVSSDGTEYQVNLTNNPLSADKYYNLRLEVDGNSYTWSLYDGTTKIAENSTTYTIDNKKVGIFLYCETGTTNSVCYIKNIKAKTLDSVIFKDKGITGDYNSDYTDVQSGITTTVGTTGTTLQASGSGDKYRKANTLVSGDFEVRYTCINATSVYGSIAFLSSSNSRFFYVEQEDTNDVYINTTAYPIGETITFPFTMTIRRVDDKLTVWYNDIQVATDVTVTSSDGYWAWKLYGNDGRQQTFKDFTIIEYNNSDSSIIFKDKCNVDNTSDYVNTVHMGSQNTNINFTFDSSANGYLFTGTGGEYFGGKVIPFSFEDKISISCDAKLLGTSAYNQCTIGITDSLNPSMSGNYDFFRIRGDNRCDYVQNNRDTSIKTGLSLVNNWVTLEVSIDGTSLTGKLFDENKTLLAQTSQITNTYSNPYIFIGLNCYGNNQKYVKNIVVKSNNKKVYLGDSIIKMINTALEHIITNWEDYD